MSQGLFLPITLNLVQLLNERSRHLQPSHSNCDQLSGSYIRYLAGLNHKINFAVTSTEPHKTDHALSQHIPSKCHLIWNQEKTLLFSDWRPQILHKPEGTFTCFLFPNPRRNRKFRLITKSYKHESNHDFFFVKYWKKALVFQVIAKLYLQQNVSVHLESFLCHHVINVSPKTHCSSALVASGLLREISVPWSCVSGKLVISRFISES